MQYFNLWALLFTFRQKNRQRERFLEKDISKEKSLGEIKTIVVKKIKIELDRVTET